MTARYMEENGFYRQLEATGVVPVVVLERVDDALPLAAALAEGGLPVAEVTFRTAAAADCIRAIAQDQSDVLVGAGTIVNLEQAKRAVDAGARFIVSPGWCDAVVDWCFENHVNVVPGTVTPTEIMAAVNRGISVTKYFPANLYGGLKGIESLASVFPGHRFMPTGGVSPDNLGDFLRSPAVVAAGGTWMVKPALFRDGDFTQVKRLTAEAAAAVTACRSM